MSEFTNGETPTECPKCGRTTIYQLGYDEDTRENVWADYICGYVWRVDE